MSDVYVFTDGQCLKTTLTDALDNIVIPALQEIAQEEQNGRVANRQSGPVYIDDADQD